MREAYKELRGMPEWRGMTMVDWVEQAFYAGGAVNTAPVTDETIKNKEYVETKVLPLVREWWLGSAMRAVVRRRVWTNSLRSGVTISEMVPVSSEAFLLTVLKNSEAQWYARYMSGKTQKDKDYPRPRFTDKKDSKRSIGFRGWSAEGVKDFNENHPLVKTWRAGRIRLELEKTLAEKNKLSGPAHIFDGSPQELARRRRLVDQVRPIDSLELFRSSKGGGATPLHGGQNTGGGDQLSDEGDHGQDAGVGMLGV